jgi:S-adenosylmethionine decarboxylase proenzyme
MQALGRQILIEFYDCQSEALTDRDRIRQYMLEAARHAGATVISDTFHHFKPDGVSGVVVIAESHISIHTWPEHRYAAVDVFTCGDSVDPWGVPRYLQEKLQAENVSSMEIKRGLFQDPVQYKPTMSET